MRRWPELSFVFFMFVFHISGCGRVEKIRVGCFPLHSSQRKIEWICCEFFGEAVHRLDGERFLITPLDWLQGQLDPDSLYSRTYVVGYAQRVGMDAAVLISGEDLSTDGTALRFEMIGTQDIQAVSDTTVIISFPLDQNPCFRVAERMLAPLCGRSFDVKETGFNRSGPWELYTGGRWMEYIGEGDRAEAVYRQILSMDSTHARTRIRLASILIDRIVAFRKEGRYTEDLAVEAAGLLRGDFFTDGFAPSRHRLLGQLYILTEHWNRAEASLEKALELDPDDANTYWNLTRLHPSRYRDLGYRNKWTILRRAIDLNPGFIRAWIDLGQLYQSQLRYRQAEKVYRSLLDIYPNSLDALLALGKLYTLRNDVLNIIDIYTRVLEIDPGKGSAYYNLGIAYYNDEREEEAVRFFKRAVEMEDHADSHFYLGVIYAKRGEKERAVEHLRRRIRLKKGNEDPFAEQARELLYDLLHENQ